MTITGTRPDFLSNRFKRHAAIGNGFVHRTARYALANAYLLKIID